MSAAVVLFHVGLSLLASAHAILTKRDARAAIAWTSFIWFVPTFGPLAYLIFGVNRIRRRAKALRPVPRERAIPHRADVARAVADEHHLVVLATATGRVSRRPLLEGNELVPLAGGEHAYAAMLEAIDAAEVSVGLSTYIFDSGPVGGRFIDALARARARGVAVRVLVDAVGLRYSWPPAVHLLSKAGVPCAAFLPTLNPLQVPFANLRNHRKILVVDGKTGFCGGMNIRDHGPVDVHFRVRGPVVADLVDVFVDDWGFATGEPLGGDAWFPPLAAAGDVVSRAIIDGPDHDQDPLLWTLLAALAQSRRSVRIATPYFIPDQALVAALGTAALRGVAVDVVLPEKSNIRTVQWAQSSMIAQTLELGCRVHLSAPPFDHSKLMVVDDAWALVGSANWDTRSLRLNFELDLECYGTAFARRVAALIDARIAHSRPITVGEIDGRPLPVRLRDGAARLLSPYL